MTETTAAPKDWTPLRGECKELTKRGLKKETLAFWNYQLTDSAHVANYYEGGKLIGQKIRRAGKQFSFLGDGKNAPLYGQWLWTGGKNLVITEGEIDALTMSQVFDNKWPVVSLPNGAQSAAKAIERAYEWLDRFDRIVLMFDMDDPGKKAAKEVADLLPPGKAAIAELPEKDANEVLLKHGVAKLKSCFWDAPTYRPDGIINGADLKLEDLWTNDEAGWSLPYPQLQDKLLGIRRGEITLLTAGSGIGKSTLAREIAYHFATKHGLSVGNVYLEESNRKTAKGYVAIDNSVPLGKLRHDRDIISEEAWRTSYNKLMGARKMWFYDHFGSLESANLIAKLRYFAVVCKVDVIVLDHISIVTSGMESSSEGERKDIDILMTKLRSLAEETGVSIIAIVHLKRAQGKNFNEGGQVSLNDLRGSASLEQLSDTVIGLERDQQLKAGAEDATFSTDTEMRVRILKCRETGETGEADMLDYNRQTGRITLAGEVCPFDVVEETKEEEPPF